MESEEVAIDTTYQCTYSIYIDHNNDAKVAKYYSGKLDTKFGKSRASQMCRTFQVKVAEPPERKEKEFMCPRLP